MVKRKVRGKDVVKARKRGSKGKGKVKVPKNVEKKMIRILRSMSEKKGLVVAFSGGVDSTVIARLAKDALGRNAVAVTADSESLPRAELSEARRLAKAIGIEHLVIKHSELENEQVVRNPENRCYFCRKELADLLKAVAGEKGHWQVVDGINASDLGEHRPGIKAADEAGIWHPFIEFKVSKRELRAMARALGLAVHDKPAAACLSSRIPYGEEITKEKLAQVEDAEDFLRGMGFRQVRVRHHNEVARIEVPSEKMEFFQDPGLRKRIIRRLKELGFRYVTLDIQGYRAGSMDEVFEED